MPVTLALVFVGIGGIAFYIRFLVALSRERKAHSWTGGHWIRQRFESDVDPICGRGEQERKESRAA